MAAAVSAAGGLGSLPCALLDPATAASEISSVRQRVSEPLNVNFFCHSPVADNPDRNAAWQQRLATFYAEFGVDASCKTASVNRLPFDDAMCKVVEELKPEVVSFHFGLPAPSLLERVKAIGSIVISSATTVAEARWLDARGCDAIIAQGCEAGGHRGMFLGDNIATQVGTLALVPQVVDAVTVPVIAAGGIADGRGIAAAFALGAAAVQIGTAYLLTPESLVSELHRHALRNAEDDQTALTNVFSGRPARGIMNRIMREVGLIAAQAPAFPGAGTALAPLKVKAEAGGSADFSSLWSGQAASLAQEMGSAELTRKLAHDALQRFRSLAGATTTQT
jgi:nitronate monooxygenase